MYSIIKVRQSSKKKLEAIAKRHRWSHIDTIDALCDHFLATEPPVAVPSVADADDDGVPSSKSATSKHSDSAQPRQEK